MKTVLSLILLLFVVAVSFAQAPMQTGQPVNKSEVSASKDATATLVIYRPKRFYGSGLTPSVFIDGEEVARMDNGRYVVVTAKPGTLKIDHFDGRPHPMKKGQNVCGANATGTIDRGAFGVDWGKSYGFKMDVKLEIQVEALAAAS